MLCFNCNGALGQFRDRPDLMLRAVAYLRNERFPDDTLYGFHVVIGASGGRRPAGEPPAA